MKFIDSFVVKYVKKDKKNILMGITKQLSEFLEKGFKCDLVANENFGRVKIELYETDEEGDLVYFNGLSLTRDVSEWLLNSSEFRTFSKELKIEDSFIVDIEISEIADNYVKGLILKNNVIYVLLSKQKTENMTNNEITKLVVKTLVEKVFESNFDEEEYEYELESELTDFFSWGDIMSGIFLLSLGILIILAVFFSLSNSFWLFIGFFISIFGVYKLIKSFPNGIGALIVGVIIIISSLGFVYINFWEFILVLLGAGLIEGGLRIAISNVRNNAER